MIFPLWCGLTSISIKPIWFDWNWIRNIYIYLMNPFRFICTSWVSNWYRDLQSEEINLFVQVHIYYSLFWDKQAEMLITCVHCYWITLHPVLHVLRKMTMNNTYNQDYYYYFKAYYSKFDLLSSIFPFLPLRSTCLHLLSRWKFHHNESLTFVNDTREVACRSSICKYNLNSCFVGLGSIHKVFVH